MSNCLSRKFKDERLQTRRAFEVMFAHVTDCAGPDFAAYGQMEGARRRTSLLKYSVQCKVMHHSRFQRNTGRTGKMISRLPVTARNTREMMIAAATAFFHESLVLQESDSFIPFHQAHLPDKVQHGPAFLRIISLMDTVANKQEQVETVCRLL